MLSIRLTPLFVLIIFFSSFLNAQAPLAQLKVKDKSGFLGIGPPRFVTLTVSNQGRQFPLNSDNVNSGPFIYFLCRPAADWKLEADFVKEDLSRLIILQNEQRFGITWKGEIISDTAGTSVLFGFPKEVKLFQSFLFQIPVGDATSQVEYVTPEDYWPWYTLLRSLSQQAEALMGKQQFRDAIAVYEQILLNSALEIFPHFAQVREKRTDLFERSLSVTWSAFLSLTVNQTLSLKERLAEVDQYKPVFQYVVDSLPKASLQIDAADPSVQSILERGREALARATATRESLQNALDEQNVRWIIEGSATGRTGYQYQYIIEALTYAFTSLDFSDTSRSSFKTSIPDELEAKLARYELMESYETFIRMCSERFVRRQVLYPPNFLNGVQKDSSSFPLPYYSALKAVQEYYSGNFDAATEDIFNVFRTTYDLELSSRLDFIRVLIDMRQRNISLEILKVLDEAKLAEARKNPDAALERYRQSTMLAPNFAYASFALGRYYASVNDPIRALTFFARAYQIDSLYLSAYREAYSLYRKGGNFKPMLDLLTKALQSGNNFWEINFNLGHASMGDGDPARAIQYFEKALALNSRSYQTNIQLGLAYQTTKNFQKAREHFNRAIDIDPLRQEAVDFLNRLNELQKAGR